MRERDGRFSDVSDPVSLQFGSSVADDLRLIRQDIRGSIAHARMLGSTGIIAEEEAQLLITTLQAIRDDVEAGMLTFDDAAAEDIHMAIELEVRARIGETGSRLHTARSRNDQVALDLHLFVVEACSEVENAIKALQDVIIDVAEQHADSLMPGYTHLQPAQPITLGFHLMAYCFMFQRDRSRIADCCKRTDQMPLGSAALAGTAFPVDQWQVAGELGFSRLYENAADAVSDRDFIMESVSGLAICALHLSRLAEDIILWSSPGFSFCQIPDELASGSSIMPQKKNPDVAELIRGRSARIWGELFKLGMIGKGLPLSYNRDLQEMKQPLFSAVDTVVECLEITGRLLAGLTFDLTRMEAATRMGFLTATDVADAITMTGVPFRTAHRQVGRLVRHLIEQGIELDAVTEEHLREVGIEPGIDINELTSAAGAVARRTSVGGTAPDRVREQIALAKACNDRRD